MTDTGMAERAARGAEDRRGHHLVWLFVGITLTGLAVLASAFFSYRAASTDEIRTLDDRADENAAVANQLADQVEQLGGTPVVEPPAAGEPGADGSDGRDGVDGQSGADGRDGRAGEPGSDGDDGTPGTAGADGQDGATPPCMAEQNQCRGADGQNGRDGVDGNDGAQGPPGPTCPDGYTAASRTYDPTPLLSGDEETWWVCVANEGQA